MGESGVVDGTTTSNGISMGVHWYDIPSLSFGPVTKYHIRDAVTDQGISLPDIYLKDERDVGFYISLYPQSGMVLGSEGI